MSMRASAVSIDGKPALACICTVTDTDELEMWDGFNCPRQDDPTKQDWGKARRMWWPQESCKCGGTRWVCLMCHGAGHIISAGQGYKVIPCPNCTTQNADGVVDRRYLRVEARQAEYVEPEWERVYEHAA